MFRLILPHDGIKGIHKSIENNRKYNKNNRFLKFSLCNEKKTVILDMLAKFGEVITTCTAAMAICLKYEEIRHKMG